MAANFEDNETKGEKMSRALLQKSLDVLTCSYTNDDEMNTWHKRCMDVIAEIREALASPKPAQPEQESIVALLLQSKQNHECNFGPSAAADWIYSDLLELLDTDLSQRQLLLTRTAWNKQIRDSVDSLLEQAGYQPDSSARNALSMMNFDAPPQRQPLTNCRQCGGPDNVLCGGQCKTVGIGDKP